MIGLSAAFVFTGCSKDSDSTPETHPASIVVFKPIDGMSVKSLDDVSLKFTVTSVEGVKHLKITNKQAGAIMETTVTDVDVTDNKYLYTYSKEDLKAGPVGTEVYTITITDEKNNITTKSVSMQVVSGFSSQVLGSFYNIQGSKPGSYDLVSAEQRVSSDLESLKDMKNTDALLFTGSWVAANSTLYVKLAPTFDYDKGASIAAIAAYNAGTKTASISTPVLGDLYMARLRGSDVYAIIKITANDPSNNDCACPRTGKLSFGFKKTI